MKVYALSIKTAIKWLKPNESYSNNGLWYSFYREFNPLTNGIINCYLLTKNRDKIN